MDASTPSFLTLWWLGSISDTVSTPRLRELTKNALKQPTQAERLCKREIALCTQLCVLTLKTLDDDRERFDWTNYNRGHSVSIVPSVSDIQTLCA